MRFHEDAANLTPEHRFSEIASLLASGVLRLRARAALPTDAGQLGESKDSQESNADRLELPEKTVLSVHRG